MADETLRRKVSSTFKLYGFSLRSEACNFLASQLLPISNTEREEWLEKITDYVQKQAPTNSTVEKNHIETAIQECVKCGLDESETVINVINAFHVPRFSYNLERKKFLKSVQNTPQLFDMPKSKAALYRNRFTILQQRTARHTMFTPNIIGTGSASESSFQMRPIEYFLSSSGKISQAVVLGMLTQLREGKFYLEDPTGTLQLDLSQAIYHVGLFTENCIILCDGWYEDKIFHIESVGFPPPELTATSRIYFGNVNTFGGSSTVSLRNSSKLLTHEQGDEDGMIVFISDLWLDSIKVMDKLQALLSGYADFPPIAFVLMGNFLSSQHGSTSAHMLKTHFKSLAELILQTPLLVEKSLFIFVPGPSDPIFPKVLPRPPLPPSIIEEFQRRIPSAVFTTNPCRIQYCTQEIVVVREDLVTKMCRNTIHFPSEKEIPEHFARTIISQAHLAPLPLSVCPIYWSFDNALQLYPLPDLIVTADLFNAFTTSYLDCQVINPGSFPKSEFAFKVYIPASRQVEDSQIPNE